MKKLRINFILILSILFGISHTNTKPNLINKTKIINLLKTAKNHSIFSINIFLVATTIAISYDILKISLKTLIAYLKYWTANKKNKKQTQNITSSLGLKQFERKTKLPDDMIYLVKQFIPDPKVERQKFYLQKTLNKLKLNNVLSQSISYYIDYIVAFLIVSFILFNKKIMKVKFNEYYSQIISEFSKIGFFLILIKGGHQNNNNLLEKLYLASLIPGHLLKNTKFYNFVLSL